MTPLGLYVGSKKRIKWERTRHHSTEQIRHPSRKPLKLRRKKRERERDHFKSVFRSWRDDSAAKSTYSKSQEQV